MGLYDIYAGIQLKVGNVSLQDFKVGDAVPIPDGVYLAREGVVVIKEGRFLTSFKGDEVVFDKWGDEVNVEEVIENRNPMMVMVQQIVAEKEGHRIGFQKSEEESESAF